MIITNTIQETRLSIAQARKNGKTIGLVPTMGALHEGHHCLIRQSVERCDYTAVSIFVNPTQFGPNEDLEQYPRTLQTDTKACQKIGADLVFAPTPDEIYPDENLTWVNVQKLGEHLCGQSRPGHFRGVCTVVCKLFNIIQPDFAFFGQKDAQQLAIIQKMTRDLNIPVQICSCPTVREADGLAKSSRNQYLSPSHRMQAPVLYRALHKAQELFQSGTTCSTTLISAIETTIKQQPDAQIDYISIVDQALLHPVTAIQRPALIALAVRFGPTRLIDNITLDPASKNT